MKSTNALKQANPLDQLGDTNLWAEPYDLFSGFELPDVSLSYFPSVIADYAADQGELLGADPAAIAVAAIGACSAALDDRIEIQVKRHDPTWREQARLWLALIGDPSAKKTPIIKKATAPLWAIHNDWHKEARKKIAEWERDCEGLKKGDEKPPKPDELRLIVQDATVEKLASILEAMPARGIVSLPDELTGWLASMDCYKSGNKDRAHWLEAYNGGPRLVDRVKGSTFVDNWGIGVIGGIQPSVIYEYAKATNHDGMLQRFILLYARRPSLGVDRRPDFDAKKAYSDVVKQLAETKPALGSVVTLSEASHVEREALEHLVHRRSLAVNNPFLSAALGKWPGLFARLLLTYHAIECATDRTYPTDRQVSGQTAGRVADLIRDVLLPHAVRFYEGMDPSAEDSKLLAALILAKGWERFTVKRTLQREWRHSRQMKPWEIDQTLDRLEAFAWIEPDETSGINERGRPKAYLVNPLIHKRFAEHAESERHRRAEVAEIMHAMTQQSKQAGNVVNVACACE